MIKIKWFAISLLLICSVAIIFALIKNSGKEDVEKNTLFESISPDSSNIHFANNITTTDSLNIFTYEYLYNGAGIGIGDFNNDGLPDIFFAGNQVPCKIFINKGNFHFEDITQNSGISIDKGWPFGVSVVDINQDGRPDIYVSVGGPGNKDIYPNKLFVNQGLDKNGSPNFKEMANEYGLADSGPLRRAPHASPRRRPSFPPSSTWTCRSRRMPRCASSSRRHRTNRRPSSRAMGSPTARDARR